MAATRTITLDGRDYEIRPLTLGQLRAITVGATKHAMAKAGLQLDVTFDSGLEIIAAALQRDHPEMTMEALLGQEATLDEYKAAIETVLDLSGFGAKGKPSGEAKAGESPAGQNSGAGSTAL